MSAGVLLGIDLGTSAVKALAVTPAGEVLGRGTGTYGIHREREGWAEQEPEAWWEAVTAAVRQALGAAAERAGARPPSERTSVGAGSAGGRLPRVLAVGLSGQVNGVVPVDNAGRPLRPAIIWLDQRAAKEADRINRTAGDLLAQTALGAASPIHAASKVLWLLGHEPERMRVAWKVLFPKDFLGHRLTGRAVTDVTDAGAALLLDLRRRGWAGDLLERLGIPPALLPEVVESPTPVGEVTAGAGAALGIAPGTPVVAGAGDMAAITAGTGVIRPGLGCTILGTAGQIALFAASPPERQVEAVWPMAAPIPGAYFWHGLVMTAAYCLTWLAGVVGDGAPDGPGAQPDVAALAAEAEASPLGSRGLVFLPFLDGAATPHADPAARGAFFGITAMHRRADLVRAVMEGVAYNVRDAFEVFASQGQHVVRVHLGGGGSRSHLWRQILADVLGVQIEVVVEPDASALGAAVIAAVGAGLFDDFPSACGAMVRLGERVSPDRARRALYDGYYGVYRQIYPRVRDLAHTLGTLGQAQAVPSTH